jgi:hypothetical protein
VNKNWKKVLIFTSASTGLLTLSAVTADVARAGSGYASGSASVTNIDGSTYSSGGEFGGKGVYYNSVTVAPIFASVSGGLSMEEFDRLFEDLFQRFSSERITLEQALAELFSLESQLESQLDSPKSSSYKVASLTVSSNSLNATKSQTIDEQVVKTLNILTSNGTSMPTANLSNYVGIIRAAGGSDGLE